MFSNLRKRLEDGLDAVEAMAVGTTVQGSPRLGRQDSVSSFTDASSLDSAPDRQSMEGSSSQVQHSSSFGYLPYQPRAAAQLADSAMSNLRRSLSLQRSGSVNSGNSEASPQERKVSRGFPNAVGVPERETVQAPAPRRTAGISLEERLRANFTIGEASGSPTPARQLTPTTHASMGSTSEPLASLEPVDVPLPVSRPGSPQETTPVVSGFPLDPAIDPASIHLPMSPPTHNPLLFTVLDTLGEPRSRTLSASAVTLHPLSPPPPEPTDQTDHPEHPTAGAGSNELRMPSTQNPQPERSVHRPPNIVVDISAPQSTLVTPSDFATAESRSDITDGTPNASVDNLNADILHNSLLAVEVQNTPSSATNELLSDPVPITEPDTAVNLPSIDNQHGDTAPNGELEVENWVEAKLQDRLKVVEQRFSDISTSFKRLQAEKVAADKLIKEVSSLEGLSDLDALRDYMVNQKMKVEISNEEIKRLMAQTRQQDERLEEVREMHKMESSSQSDLVEKLRQQLTESEALLKVAESDSTAQKTGLSQHEAEIERLKALLKDEEEKRVKAITLLKTVRQKLTKAEKDRDDIAKEREKDKEDISAARAEIERAERARNERERDIAGMRDRFEKEIRENRERHERELAARKGQYELDLITIKAAHAKELSMKTSRIASFESTISSLTTERDSLFEQSQLRQAEAESAQSHLQTVQNQVSELQYQLREAEDRNSLLVDELDELRNGSRLSTHSPTPGPEVARLLSEAEGKFEGRLSEMRMKLRATEKERNEAEDDWNKTLADRGKEIEKLRFALRQAEDKWLESGRVGKGMDEKVAALELNVKELHTQRDTWNVERLSITEELKKAQDTLNTLQNDHAEVLGRVASFETQLEESKSREVYLKTSNKTLRDELRKVQSSAALLERQRPGGVGFWSANPSGTSASKNGNGVTSPLQSPRPGSPTVSEVGSISAKQEEEVNLEYIRNVILQFLEHKEMRPNLVRVLSTILRFTPQETHKRRRRRAPHPPQLKHVPLALLFVTSGWVSHFTRAGCPAISSFFPNSPKRFTKDHEWVSYDSDTKIGTVSITDHAQKQLGDVVFIELPAVGSKVEFGEPMGAVESVKAASDICAPMSGTVKEVNPAIGEKPSLLNSSPEDQGWLCKIEVSDPTEVDKLLSVEDYVKYCENAE
ncbi:hypothetical protein FRC10_003668 [Ceratobasidium sp. 414]|nr:hypothetical protein FRC10_003668 [Ceratobasidium sp. 414]